MVYPLFASGSFLFPEVMGIIPPTIQLDLDKAVNAAWSEPFNQEYYEYPLDNYTKLVRSISVKALIYFLVRSTALAELSW